MRTDVFYPTVCNLCKGVGIKVRRCSGCRLVVYCSQEHQKDDWPGHRELCRCVQTVLKEAREESIFHAVERERRISDWCELRLTTMHHVESLLKRKMFPHEKQVFLFPATCLVCSGRRIFKLHICPECNCVAYCSQAHLDLHKESHCRVCPTLKLCRQIDFHMTQPSFVYPLVQMDIREDEASRLPGDIETLLKVYTGETDSALDVILKSEVLTCVATLMFALQHSRIVPKSNLTIHIVGASQIEYSFYETLEIMFHWFPSLKKLNLIFVGPECIEETKVTLCDACTKTRVVNFETSKDLYHVYLKSHSITKPDIIVAFNCGLHEYENEVHQDTWKDSIPSLLSFSPAILVLTSYNMTEAGKDLSRVLRLNANPSSCNLLLNCQQNPFRSLRPHRDWEQNADSIFYQNNIISIVQT